MKKRRAGTTVLAALCGWVISCGGLSAADAPKETSLERPGKERGGRLNRVELRGRATFNVKASFGGIGGFAPQETPWASAVGDKRYDNGFVLDDPDGNVPTAMFAVTTDTWQYQSAAQQRASGGMQYLDMTVSSANPTLNSADADGSGIEPGFELAFSRQLGGGGRLAWGIGAAFGYSRVGVEDSRSLVGSSIVFRDSYNASEITGSVVSGLIADAVPVNLAPPPAGNNTGTRLPVAPTPAESGVTTIVPGGALTTGLRELETDVMTLRLGPVFDYRLSERVSVGLGVGGVGALLNSDFQYSESTTIAGIGPGLRPGLSATQTSSGRVSDTVIKGGGYAELTLSARLTERVSAQVGAQYLYTGKLRQAVDVHTASLNLNHSIGLFGGVSFDF